MDGYLDLNYIGRGEKLLENQITTMSDFIFRSEWSNKKQRVTFYFIAIELFVGYSRCFMLCCFSSNIFFLFVHWLFIWRVICTIVFMQKEFVVEQQFKIRKFVLCFYCCHSNIFVNLMRPMPWSVNHKQNLARHF